jgi:hypothetical protein
LSGSSSLIFNFPSRFWCSANVGANLRLYARRPKPVKNFFELIENNGRDPEFMKRIISVMPEQSQHGILHFIAL